MRLFTKLASGGNTSAFFFSWVIRGEKTDCNINYIGAW